MGSLNLTKKIWKKATACDEKKKKHTHIAYALTNQKHYNWINPIILFRYFFCALYLNNNCIVVSLQAEEYGKIEREKKNTNLHIYRIHTEEEAIRNLCSQIKDKSKIMDILSLLVLTNKKRGNCRSNVKNDFKKNERITNTSKNLSDNIFIKLCLWQRPLLFLLYFTVI